MRTSRRSAPGVRSWLAIALVGSLLVPATVLVAQGLEGAPSARKFDIVQGFNIRRWSQQHLNLLAVSDLNADELGEFGTRFETATEKAAP